MFVLKDLHLVFGNFGIGAVMSGQGSGYSAFCSMFKSLRLRVYMGMCFIISNCSLKCITFIPISVAQICPVIGPFLSAVCFPFHFAIQE